MTLSNSPATRYVLVEEQIDTPELGPRRSFGIAALRPTGHGYEEIAHVRDVSTDQAFAAGLTERCNHAQLSSIHLQDFIADVLES